MDAFERMYGYGRQRSPIQGGFYDAAGRMPNWRGFDPADGPDQTGFYTSPCAQWAEYIDHAEPYQGMRPAHTEAGLMDLLDNVGFTRGVVEFGEGRIDFYLDERQVTQHRIQSLCHYRMGGIGWQFKTLTTDLPHGSFVMIKSKPRVAAT